MRLRILTYNIHRAIGVDRRFRPDRVVEILEQHDADVALLQEVDEGVPRSREMDLARELAAAAGYPYVAVGHNVALRKGRYGNATLSRHPIVRERNIDLTVGLRKRRGCQHTEIRVAGSGRQGQSIDLFNVHLGLSARERDQQLRLLARSGELAGLSAEAACLLVGDFNDWRSLLRVALAGLGFRCATESSGVPTRPFATFPSFFPQGPLDRIYYRGPLHLHWARICRLRASRVASDHLPVIAEFTLKPARILEEPAAPRR
jgi:endonuclease/exonuclease/phosphatase family metal-dependent hydrolase